MLNIYYKNSTTAQRRFLQKCILLFERENVPYHIQQIGHGVRLTREQIMEIAQYCFMGYMDLVSRKGHFYERHKEKILNMTLSQFATFLTDYQEILLPDLIMFNGGYIAIGRTMEDISSFVRMAHREHERELEDRRRNPMKYLNMNKGLA